MNSTLTPRLFVLGMLLSAIVLGSVAVILCHQRYVENRRVMEVLDSEIGRPISVPGLSEAVVVASDVRDVWIAEKDGAGRTSITRFGRDRVGMELKQIMRGRETR